MVHPAYGVDEGGGCPGHGQAEGDVILGVEDADCAVDSHVNSEIISPITLKK